MIRGGTVLLGDASHQKSGNKEAARMVEGHVEASGEVVVAPAAGEDEAIEAGVAARERVRGGGSARGVDGVALDEREGGVEPVERNRVRTRHEAKNLMG